MEKQFVNLLSRCKLQSHRSMFIIPNINRNRIINKLYSLLAEKTVFLPECVWITGNKSTNYRETTKKVKGNDLEKHLDHDTLDIPQNSLRSLTPTTLNKLLGSTVQLLIIENVLDPHVLAKSIETVQGNGMIILILGNKNIPEDEYLQLFKSFDFSQKEGKINNIVNDEISKQEENYILNTKTSVYSSKNIDCMLKTETSSAQKDKKPFSDNIQSPKKHLSLYNHRIFQSFKRSKCMVILNQKMKIINNPIDSLSVQDLDLVYKKFSADSEDPLTKICVTADQAKTLRLLSNSLLTPEKALLMVTAARGRGKSALLGLAIAQACTGQITLRNGPNDLENNQYSTKENKSIKENGNIQEIPNSNIEQFPSTLNCMIPIISYKHIHVIAPFIENVATIFEFLILGLNKLGYRENRDFQVVKLKKNRSYVKEIVLYGTYMTKKECVAETGDHQEETLVKRYPLSTISYNSCLSAALNHPDLLVIDEASSIPLSTLYTLLRANKVLLASTVEGYEGTGRALHHKFLKSFMESNDSTIHTPTSISPRNNNKIAFESVQHLQLHDSIRYSSTDPIERWLNRTILIKSQTNRKMSMKPIEQLKLYGVDKFGLFAAYTSHNKNNPDKNDYERKENLSPSHLVSLNIGKISEKHEQSMKENIKSGNTIIPREIEQIKHPNNLSQIPKPSEKNQKNSNDVQKNTTIQDKSTKNDTKTKNSIPQSDLSGENLLRKIVSLFTTSHYRNTPGDLKILADTPNHHVLALTDGNFVFCAAHIAIEEGSMGSSNKNFASIDRSGNLIPWLLHDQYEIFNEGKSENKSIKGLRIVRLAVHPDFQGMGYGSETVRQIISIFKNTGNTKEKRILYADNHYINSINPLFRPLVPIPLDFIGVSLSLNPRIHSFFNKLGFLPIHLGQNVNQTGEFSCAMMYMDKQPNSRPSNKYPSELEYSSEKENFKILHCREEASTIHKSYSENEVSSPESKRKLIPASLLKEKFAPNPETTHSDEANSQYSFFMTQLLKHHHSFKLKLLRMACPVWMSLGIESILKFVTNDIASFQKIKHFDHRLTLSEFDRSRLNFFISYQCDYSVIRDCLKDIAIFYFMNRGLEEYALLPEHLDENNSQQKNKIPSFKMLLPKSQEIILLSIGILSLTPDQIVDQLDQINRETIILLLRKAVKHVLIMIRE